MIRISRGRNRSAQRSALTSGLVFAARPFGPGFLDVVSGLVSIEANTTYMTTSLTQAISDGAAHPATVPSVGRLAAVDNRSGHTFALQTGVDQINTRGTLLVLGGMAGGSGTAAGHMFGSHEWIVAGYGAMVGIDNNFYSGQGRIVGMMRTLGTAGLNLAFTNNGAVTISPNGKLHFFGMGWDGTDIYGYSSGVANYPAVQTIAFAEYAALDSNRRTWIGKSGVADGSETYNDGQGFVSLALAWNRPLTLDEYAELWADPEKVFRSSRNRVYYAEPRTTTPYISTSKIRRRRQPEIVVGVDQNNSLSSGLVFALLPPLRVDAYTQKTISTNSGSLLFSQNGCGLARLYNSSSADQIEVTDTLQRGVTYITGVSRNTAIYERLLANSANNQNLEIFTENDGHTFDLMRDGGRWGAATIDGVSAYTVIAWAQGADASVAPDAYVNGDTVSVSTVLAGSASPTSAAGTYYIGLAGNGSDYGSALGMNFSFLWNRKLSASEIRSISDNPWQILTTKRSRIYSFATPQYNVTEVRRGNSPKAVL